MADDAERSANAENQPDNTNEGDSDNGDQRKPRKRQRKEDDWIRNRRKVARNQGKGYTTGKGKCIPPKTFKDFNCQCKRNCVDKLPLEVRSNCFMEYWKIGSWEKQNLFLHENIKVTKIARRTTLNKEHSKKRFTRSFTLNGVKVCKLMFRDTLNINDGRIHRAIAHKRPGHSSFPKEEKRGRHGHQPKIPRLVIDKVKRHIESFPKYVSHYTRSHQVNKKYLNPNLNISKMYDLFVDKCKAENTEAPKAWLYRYIFLNHFNLSFKSPQKDTCKTCDRVRAQLICVKSPDAKRKLEKERDLHQRQAEKARSSLSGDKAISKSDTQIHTMTFDLQKTLPTPDITTGLAFYKRQLWTYNLGIHDCNTDLGYMFMWDETTAARGSNEVASCIYKYISEQVPESVDHIISYSDTCPGQNRNINMVRMWMYVCLTSPNVKTIDHKFLVSGHSFLPNDADFGVIEKAKPKTQEIFTPDAWYSFVRIAKRHRPYSVTEMKRSDFKDFELKEHVVHRKLDVDNNKIQWLRIQWLQFRRDSPYEMFYKYTLEDEAHFLHANFKRQLKGRPSSSTQQVLSVPISREGPVEISLNKYKDLLSLLDFIPPVHHAFYRNLRHRGREEYDQESHPDIESESSDSE